MQVITGVNTYPSRAYSTGGLFRFKDGRDFPDMIYTLYDYPDFRSSIHCNLNNDSGEHLAFYGTKGTLVIQDATLTYTPQDDSPQAESYSIGGWPKKLREEYLEQWQREHPPAAPLASVVAETAESYTVPEHYNDTVDHEANFFASVRSRKAPVEAMQSGASVRPRTFVRMPCSYDLTNCHWSPVIVRDALSVCGPESAAARSGKAVFISCVFAHAGASPIL